ncbi:MAG: FAD-binding oxidoreductase [Actinomycetota bacterium]|jgi:glycolate oxidase FAD binding subunit|nr:FAD-binding oxidoreductase [Rubrobacteraceae bacterium]MBA3701312.1 FAD-binding oxidoreductase [Rubrobacteraceae bacterium]MDQ3438312.1 FAD-binding oxidoreductase [Actinomycetota bacterium]
MQTRRAPLDDLQEIVGTENVREATAEDAVDGVEPSLVVEPGSTEEISAVMKLARSEGLAVAPRGGGTKRTLGNPPRELDLVLSTVRLDEIIEHVPGDQIVRVQSGVKLETLQESLAEANQILALDPPEKGATVGGIVAANSSGPRRYKYGTVRDLIIGITVVLADGTVAKAGGKVVKNVAGYDLSKLFTGSLGTLGVIVDANFRLHPRPESARTVAVEVETPQAAREAAQAIVHSQVEATAIELHWSESAKLLSVLLESIPAGIEAKEEGASFLLKSFGEVRTLTDEETDNLGPLSPPGEEDEVALKVAAPPAELSAVLDSVLGAAERRSVRPRITGHAGTGVTYVGLSGGEDALVEVVEEVREIWVRRGGSVMVHDAPTSFKRKLDVWGAGGDYLGLTRRVKEKFDPGYTMNPGRFLGGI